MMIGVMHGIELCWFRRNCSVAWYKCIALVLHEIPYIGLRENGQIRLYTAIVKPESINFIVRITWVFPSAATNPTVTMPEDSSKMRLNPSLYHYVQTPLNANFLDDPLVTDSPNNH